MWRRRWISLVACIPALAGTVEFNRDVRPILSDKCFQCHGADAKAKGIPVRLDVEAEAKAERGGRRAIVEGDPDSSELIRRVTSESKAKKMPPVYTGHSLTPREVETLRAWIAGGAKWERHWAFVPPRKAPLPADANAIDYFVERRLKQENLALAPEAPRETLLRRVTLDLTGLPPSPAERDAFLADRSPRAYEKAVDRLLASPAFGERMAMRWLDAARYADSNGYQFDGDRDMWRWRDYVIDSFNANKPFDRFVVEQIAGDLLPNATREQKIATGFNRNHRINTEFGIVPEEYAVEYVVDRVETFGAVFLGLTTGCARCHNHKYDPLTQKEFYRLYAFFNNVPEMGRGMKYGNSHPLIAAPTPAQQADLDVLGARIRELERRVEKQPAIIGALLPRPGVALDYEQEIPAKEPRVAGFAGQWDIDDAFTLSAKILSQATPDGPIVTRMVDSPKGRGYGLMADQGKIHFHLTSEYADDAIRVETEPVLKPGQWHRVTATYDGSKMADGVRLYVDGEAVEHKVLLDLLYRPFNNAQNVFPHPLRLGMGWGKERRFNGEIAEARAWARRLTSDQIAMMDGKANPAAQTRLALREGTALGRDLAELEWQREKMEASFPTVMIMAERPVRRDTFVLTRGEYDKPGEKVSPGVPEFLPPLPAGAPGHRLSLAQWLVSRDNPLLARVTVNRLWQMLFGTGLVKTTEDFGLQGEWPTHPELLDWLAVEYMDSGWDTKAMMKRIVMSRTYRQSSKATPESIQRDPENRLLARGPRVRLPAETIRDQALAASGLLTKKIGGPSVKPYQPDGLWAEVTMQGSEYERDQGENLYRRGLYTYWRRSVAPPMMLNFDAAQREACVVRENRTNTPLQALNLMNDEAFLEASRVLGERMVREGLASGFRRVLARDPKPEELAILKSNLAYHRDYFADEAKARDYVRAGDAPQPADIAPRELAAHMAAASMILNLDEAVTKP
jgi:hypothetical protein